MENSKFNIKKIYILILIGLFLLATLISSVTVKDALAYGVGIEQNHSGCEDDNDSEDENSHDYEETSSIAEYLQDLELSGKEIKIALLDTAISTKYQLSGFVDFTKGKKAASSKSHGSKMVDILIGNNGIAKSSKIYAAAILESENYGNFESVIKAIDWAIENKVNIISMSFEGYENHKGLFEAIEKAKESGILVIAAAGNDEKDKTSYPAKFNTVLSVGALNSDGEAVNKGGKQIDIYAPGEAYINGDYLFGTSVSTQYVTGIAALLWESAPNLNNKEIRNILKQSIDKNGCINSEKAYQLEKQENFNFDETINRNYETSNSYGFIYASACAHTSSKIGSKAATCTSGSYTEYKCSKCGYISRTTTNALGHYYYTSSSPSCGTAGKKSCSRCSSTQSIPATGLHTYTESKAPTCINTGTKTCIRCPARQTTPATGNHKFVTKTIAKCSSNGIKECTTSGCSVTQIIQKTNVHVYDGKKVAATCTADGYVYCSGGCGKTKVTANKLGHTYQESKAPTCAKTGTKTCIRCPSAQTINPTGKHKFTKLTKAATCEAAGYYTCSGSGCTTTSSIPKLGHTYQESKAPTCINTGTKTCIRCPARQTTPATGNHKLVTKTVAKCSTNGIKECTTTGCSKTEIIPMTGKHDYSHFVKEARCETEGIIACSDVNCSSLKKVDALGHIKKYYSTTDSCGSYICSRVVNRTQCDFNEYLCDFIIARDLNNKCKQIKTCKKCRYIIDAGFDHVGNKQEVNSRAIFPTCMDTGHAPARCSECKGTWGCIRIPPTGHSVKGIPSTTACDKCSYFDGTKKGTVELSWNKVKGAVCYVIYRNTEDGDSIGQVVKLNSMSYCFYSLKSGNKYDFEIRAYTKDINIWGEYVTDLDKSSPFYITTIYFNGKTAK